MLTVTSASGVGEQQDAQAVVEPVLGDPFDRRDLRDARRQRGVRKRRLAAARTRKNTARRVRGAMISVA